MTPFGAGGAVAGAGGGPTMSFSTFRFRYIFVASWLGYCGYTMARRPWSVGRSEIERDTHISAYSSGLVDSAFLLMYTVGQMMFGSHIKGRAPSKQILTIGLVGSALTCLIVAMSSSTPVFIAAWAANGAFQAVGWASCMVILTPWMSATERGTIMGVWGTNMAAGGVIGNSLTSFIIGYLGSWRAAIVVDCFVLAAIAFVLHIFLREHPNKEGFVSPVQAAQGITERDLSGSMLRTIDGEVLLARPETSTVDGAAAAPAAASEALSLRETLAIPGVAPIALSYFFHKLVRYALIFWLPYYFTKELGYSTANAGFIASVLDVGGVVGSLASGAFSDYYHGGRRRAHAVLFFVVGMALSLQGFVLGREWLGRSNVACVVVGFAAGFFSFAIDSLVTGSLLQDYADRQHVAHQLGAISGVVGGIGTAGSVLQGYVTVALSERSWETLYQGLTVLTVIAGLLMYKPLQLERQQERDDHRDKTAA